MSFSRKGKMSFTDYLRNHPEHQKQSANRIERLLGCTQKSKLNIPSKYFQKEGSGLSRKCPKNCSKQLFWNSMRKRNEPLSLLFLHLGFLGLWILFGENSAETQGRYLTKVRFIGQVICDNVPRTKRGTSLWHAQLRSHSRNFSAVTTAKMLAERNCSVYAFPMGSCAPNAAAWNNTIPSMVVTPTSAVPAGTRPP